MSCLIAYSLFVLLIVSEPIGYNPFLLCVFFLIVFLVLYLFLTKSFNRIYDRMPKRVKAIFHTISNVLEYFMVFVLGWIHHELWISDKDINFKIALSGVLAIIVIQLFVRNYKKFMKGWHNNRVDSGPGKRCHFLLLHSQHYTFSFATAVVVSPSGHAERYLPAIWMINKYTKRVIGVEKNYGTSDLITVIGGKTVMNNRKFRLFFACFGSHIAVAIVVATITVLLGFQDYMETIFILLFTVGWIITFPIFWRFYGTRVK